MQAHAGDLKSDDQVSMHDAPDLRQAAHLGEGLCLILSTLVF